MAGTAKRPLFFLWMILLATSLYPARPELFIKRVTDHDGSAFPGNPPNPGTITSNFSPDSNSTNDALVFVFIPTNTGTWSEGDYEVIVDINRDGLYTASDWIRTGSVYSGLTNYVVWDGLNMNGSGTEGNRPWIAPNNIYSTRVVVDDRVNGLITTNSRTNYLSARPATAVLGGLMTIIGPTNKSQVSLSGYASSSRYSKPVSSGQIYSVYGLRRGIYQSGGLYALNKALPSISGINLYGAYTNKIILSTGTNTINFTMASNGRTRISGKVADYQTGSPAADVKILFNPFSAFAATGSREETASDASGDYSDIYRGNGYYQYTIGDEYQSGLTYGIQKGNYYMNSNASPVAWNFYLSPKGSITIDLNQLVSGVGVRIKDAVNDIVYASLLTDANGMAQSTYPFASGLYQIVTASFSNSGTTTNFASIMSNIALIDGETAHIDLHPPKAYRVYGKVTNNAGGVADCNVRIYYTNGDPVRDHYTGRLLATNSDGQGAYRFNAVLRPGKYLVAAEEINGFPISYGFSNVKFSITSSHRRTNIVLRPTTNTIRVVYSNYSSWVDANHWLLIIAMKEKTILQEPQKFYNFYTAASTSPTNTISVDSSTDRYTIYLQPLNSGNFQFSNIIVTDYSNKRGNLVILRDPPSTYFLKGRIVLSNTADLITQMDLALFTKSTQYITEYDRSADGLFSFTNLPRPGPYVIKVGYGPDINVDAYKRKLFQNLAQNSTVTLFMAYDDTTPPAIKFVSPSFRTRSKSRSIKFFPQDNDYGSGCNTNSVRIAWLGGKGLNFGIQTLASNRVRYSDGWIIFTNTRLTNYNAIRISVADKNGNTNFITNSFTIDTNAPRITALSITDAGAVNGTHDSILGQAETPFHLSLSLASSETGNYTIWLDNNKNKTYDPLVDWYISLGTGLMTKNLSFSNRINYSGGLNFSDEMSGFYTFQDLPEGTNMFVIELDDTKTGSVEDGNKTKTNIRFIKDTGIPTLLDARTISSNKCRVIFDQNSQLHEVLELEIIDRADFSFRYAKATNITRSTLFITMNERIYPGDERLFTYFSVRDKGWNQFNQTGFTTNKDGLKPGLLNAKTLDASTILFRFNEKIGLDAIRITNKTVMSTNTSGSNISFTVTPDFTPTEATNYSITVHDLRSNTTNFAGKFKSGFVPQIREVYTLTTNQVIFKFSKPVQSVLGILILTNRTVTGTNFTSANSNIIFTVAPCFGPSEERGYSITVADTVSNISVLNGLYQDGLPPRIQNFEVLWTNIAQLTFNEPLGISCTNRSLYATAWVSNNLGTLITNRGFYPSFLDYSLYQSEPSVIVLYYSTGLFKNATNALCAVTNIFDNRTNMIDPLYRTGVDSEVKFDTAGPVLLSARTISQNQVKFTFDETIRNVLSASITNRTITATNRTFADVVFTVSPSFSADFTGNFHITVEDISFNQRVTNGVFADGLPPVLREVRTTEISNILFLYSETVVLPGFSLNLAGHTVKRTNIINGTNLVCTINGVFGYNEQTNYSVIARDGNSNASTNAGKFKDGIAPGLVFPPYTLSTNELYFKFTEPILTVATMFVPAKTIGVPVQQSNYRIAIFSVLPPFAPDEATNYMIRVLDFRSNISVVTGIFRETFPPRLISLDVLSTNMVQLKFSEALDSSRTNKSSYNISWVSNSAPAPVTNRNNFPVQTSSFRSGRTNCVNLTFGSPLFIHATNVLCRITNIFDSHGNRIDTNFSYAADDFIQFDTTPPPAVLLLSAFDENNDTGGEIRLVWRRTTDSSGLTYTIYTNSGPILSVSNLTPAALSVPQDTTNLLLNGFTDRRNYYFAVLARDSVGLASALSSSSRGGPAYSVRNQIQTASDTIYSRYRLDQYILNKETGNIGSYANFEAPDTGKTAQADNNLKPENVETGLLNLTSDTYVRLTVSPSALPKTVFLSLPLSTAFEGWMANNLAFFKMNPASPEWELISKGVYANSRIEGEVSLNGDETFRVLLIKRSSFPDTTKVAAGPSLYTGGGDGIHFVNLPAKARIRIYTVTGKLIADLSETDEDGVFIWDTHGKSGLAGSGVYVCRVENREKPSDYKVLKIAIVR